MEKCRREKSYWNHMGKQILNTTLKKKLEKHKLQIVCKLHKYNNKKILSKKCLCTTMIGVS